MQKNAPLTPKSRRLNRTICRPTMGPSDFAIPAAVVTDHRRPPSSRYSSMPNLQSTQDVAKKIECDSKDSQMKYSYNKYLQTEMIKLLVRKKSEKTDKIILTHLATVAKEEDAVKDKLFAAKTKENQLKYLISLQNNIDDRISEITEYLDCFDKRPVEMLKLLQSSLRCLDFLKCRDIVIPESKDGAERIKSLFDKCKCQLLWINQSIGTKRNSLIKVNEDLKDFDKTYSDIKDCSEKCSDILEKLQILVLKDCAGLLTKARSD